MRETPFSTIAELEAYVGGPQIQCLECGRWYRALATHLPRTHGMSHNDYREKWGIPRRYALAGTATRECLSEQMRDQIRSGHLTLEHLPAANLAAQHAPRPQKMPVDRERQAIMVATRRPGDHSMLPPGSTRADGRNAERHRLVQRIRRARDRGELDQVQRWKRELTILDLSLDLNRIVGGQPSGKGKPLPREERAFLRRHYAAHNPAILADVIGKPIGVVKAAVRRLWLQDIRQQPQGHRFRWQVDIHDPLLIEAHAAGKTMKAVASMLGTSTVTVTKHARRLRLSFRSKLNRGST